MTTARTTAHPTPFLSYTDYLAIPDPSNQDGFRLMTREEFAEASEHVTLVTIAGTPTALLETPSETGLTIACPEFTGF